MSSLTYLNLTPAQARAITDILNTSFDSGRVSSILKALESTLGAIPATAVPAATTAANGTVKKLAAQTDVVVANAVASVGVPTKAEFDAVVSLANANKVAINLLLAGLRTAGILTV